MMGKVIRRIPEAAFYALIGVLVFNWPLIQFVEDPLKLITLVIVFVVSTAVVAVLLAAGRVLLDRRGHQPA